jgi:hypothetical protein
MRLLPLRNHLPDYFHDVAEFEALIAAEQIEFDKLDYWLSRIAALSLGSRDNAIANQFIQTGDEKTITQLERLFHILADRAAESLDF